MGNNTLLVESASQRRGGRQSEDIGGIIAF